VNDDFAVVVDPSVESREESLANAVRQVGRCGDRPVHGDLGVHLVDVLATGTGTAGKRETQFAVWNGDLRIDHQHGGSSRWCLVCSCDGTPEQEASRDHLAVNGLEACPRIHHVRVQDVSHLGIQLP